MKTDLAVVIALLLAGAAMPVAAAPLLASTETFEAASVTALGNNNYAFTLGGWSGGGTMTGTFSGTDSGNGQITYFSGSGTLTAFSASLTGDRSVAPVSFSLGELFGFVYTIGNPAFGTITTGFIEGIGINAPGKQFFFGPGPLAPCDGRSVCGGVVAAAAVVPEPESWALMIVGFSAMGLTIRRRRAALAH